MAFVCSKHARGGIQEVRMVEDMFSSGDGQIYTYGVEKEMNKDI